MGTRPLLDAKHFTLMSARILMRLPAAEAPIRSLRANGEGRLPAGCSALVAPRRARQTWSSLLDRNNDVSVARTSAAVVDLLDHHREAERDQASGHNDGRAEVDDLGALVITEAIQSAHGQT